MYVSHKNASIQQFLLPMFTFLYNRSSYYFFFRHNKHSIFYRTVNIWRLILGKFFNYKTTKLMTKAANIKSEGYITLRTWNLRGKKREMQTIVKVAAFVVHFQWS
jgi:hypothetical protein